jgi:hypothetical protein
MFRGQLERFRSAEEVYVAYHAVVDDLSALGDGLADVVGDGVGVAQDVAGHATVARLDGLSHRALEPRQHSGITSMAVLRGWAGESATVGSGSSSSAGHEQKARVFWLSFPFSPLHPTLRFPLFVYLYNVSINL